MEAHLTEELQQVKWAEYRLGDLFESFNGNFDIKKEHINDVGDYVVTAGLSNNGILGKTDVEARIFDKNTITIDMFGNAFYRQFPYKMVTHARVFSLKPLFEITQKQGLFIANLLHFLKYGFGYENMCSWAKIEDKKIPLPVRGDESVKKQEEMLGLIAFDFMEHFISQLEAFRLSQLEAYLLVTGLKDYTLTTAEQQALTDFENGKVQWGEFAFENIFDTIKQGRRLKKDDQIAGDIPFVMAGITNTGVVNYISNPVATFPKNSITIDIFGNAFYRNYDFGAGDDTGVYWNSKKELSKEAMLFLTKASEKALEGKFSYGKKLRSSQSLKFKIMLPTQNQIPDYDYMQLFISAVQKLVIKNVVLYADRKIEATRDVIGNKII
ncbi:MAG: restriction endonuclease subunit S [bacterium]|nr:restriction endonuclease subunit S [bacterium]